MDRPSAVERTLREAAPHQVFDVLRSLIERRHRAVGVELLLADYSMSRLQPVGDLPHTGAPLSVHDSAAGRAFGAQQPHCVSDRAASTTTVHLPVSVRGDRLGVLSVTLPGGDGEEPAAGVLEDLRGYADALAHEVVVAERDTDLFLRARRAERLTLAAEMQWQLLPGRSCAREEYSIGAQLAPAYAIHGDSFDWSASADDLVLTVNNGMGEGIDAALLTNLAVNALRNARRAGLGLADQAYLADQAVYGQHGGASTWPPSCSASTWPPATWRSSTPDRRGSGGCGRGRWSPSSWRPRCRSGCSRTRSTPCRTSGSTRRPAVLRERRGVRRPVTGGGEVQPARPDPGDYRHTAAAGVAEVPRAVLEALLGHRGSGGPATDDALVVCLDWHGRPGAG